MARRNAGLYTPAGARWIVKELKELRQIVSGLRINRNQHFPIQQQLLPAYFRNDSGEAIPAFACIQIIGTINTAGSWNYLQATKPIDSTGEAGFFLFNGPNAVPWGPPIAYFGNAQQGTVMRALSDGTAVTPAELRSPEFAEWHLKLDASGLFRVAGEDDVMADIIKVQYRGADAGAANFYVYELTSTITPGTPSTATCKIYDPLDESTVIESGLDWVGNLTMFDDQTTGDKGTGIKVGDTVYAVNAPC